MKLTADHIQQSIDNALAGKSNLTDDMFGIRGFSTPTIRSLFNNLCNTEEQINYLEIGLFCGATFCSSFNKNCTSIGIENHSQDFSAGFETVKQELIENVSCYANRAKDVKIYYDDCFEIDKSVLPKIDIYSFDGFHSFETQSKALPEFLNCMNDKFIFLVDDLTWNYVHDGTAAGFSVLKNKIEIEKSWVLGYGYQDSPVWHNGIGVFLINKK